MTGMGLTWGDNVINMGFYNHLVLAKSETSMKKPTTKSLAVTFITEEQGQ